jgi:Ala-tRNA(Pro) deacylase
MHEKELCQYLQDHGIQYQRIEHPAVYTVEQADRYLLHAPGARTKNLFISDEKKERYFILWTPADKKVYFNPFGRQLGLGKPRFGSEEKLMQYLGIEPGSVSVLGIINDSQNKVEVLVDREPWQEESFQCHPLVNTATLVISKQDIIRFFELTGHHYHLVDVPAKV